MTDPTLLAASAEDEERFRLLVESVGDYAIFMLDVNGIVTTWNLGAQRIKGYQPSEIIGQHFSVFYSEEERRANKTQLELEVAARDGRFEDEGWRVRKDGSQIWANVVITAVRAPKDGRLIGFSKVTRDLTARRLSEEQRVELAKAREAVRLRDEFISVASHELRTPLSTLRLQADGIARAIEKGTLTPERLANRLKTVSSQINRLERLVTSLLDVSRIESGRLQLDREAIDLAMLARDVGTALADELERACCTLVVHSDAPVIGSWDRARLDQVITNLLTNAAKYGASKPIKIEVHEDATRATLSVTDQGIGIAPEHQASIFGRFQRAADARYFGGLGLGLWLAREIALAHGGEIEVSSQLGAGATFSVQLPKLSP